MTIGELARRARLTARAIRHYEALGLVRPSLRSEANYRLYDAASVPRLRFIANCRVLGFSIAEIGALLRVVDDPDHTCAQAASVARYHLDLIDDRLRELATTRDLLARFLARCATPEAPDCPLLEDLSDEALADHAKVPAEGGRRGPPGGGDPGSLETSGGRLGGALEPRR